ncbi:MAG: gliding motility-associated C-terminal domain-containing protein, partial [Bacteroidetes bacterium]|nr:gliding motility-associated C-terminal domain-containing protein [Bacteroidota bacterium]
IVEKAQYYNNVEVIVFDRWGRIVYQSNSYDNSWEGTSTTGEPLPDGAYYYVVKVPVEREEYKGSITIFR